MLPVVLVAALLPLVALGIFLGAAVRRILRQDDETKPWRGLGTWWPVEPDERVLEWVRHVYPAGPMRMFQLGHGDRITAAMHGQHRGFQAAAFEWTWHELAANQPRSQHRTVVCLQLPVSVPRLEIRRGGRGLNADPELGWAPFDDNFRVFTQDLAFARAVLTPAVMEWLLADGRSAYYPISFDGTTVSTIDGGGLHSDTLGPPVDFLAELLTRVPPHIWNH